MATKSKPKNAPEVEGQMPFGDPREEVRTTLRMPHAKWLALKRLALDTGSDLQTLLMRGVDLVIESNRRK